MRNESHCFQKKIEKNINEKRRKETTRDNMNESRNEQKYFIKYMYSSILCVKIFLFVEFKVRITHLLNEKESYILI